MIINYNMDKFPFW